MAREMTIEKNTEEGRRGRYIRIPRCTYKENVSPSAKVLQGKIYSSRSKNDQAGGEMCCRLTYKQAQSELGISAPTVRNSLSVLKKKGKIKASFRDKNGMAYTSLEEYAGKHYDVLPEYLLNDKFLIDGKMRTLTKGQAFVLAHIMTLAGYAKNDGAAPGSARIFARTLNLSEKTVRSAINVLLKGGLIYRRAEEKGVNGNKLSKYRPNKRLYEYKQAQKKPRKATTSKLHAAVEAANAKAERDRYYAQQQEENRRKVEKYMSIANRNARFKEINVRIKAMQKTLAEEELAGGNTYKLMEQKLRKERSELLKKMEIRPEWLEEGYFCKCKKCGDTGFLSNGKSCTCYLKE